jgi:hypothetical protein
MRTLPRPAILVSVAAAAAMIAVPTAAMASTTDARTSLNARAAKDVVAPKHQDTVYLTLRSHKTGVTGEEANFLVRTRRDTGTSPSAWSTWTAVTATPGTKAGRYRVTVTMPAKIGHGKKEQYQVKFAGDSTNHLAASRSQVFTVTAR